MTFWIISVFQLARRRDIASHPGNSGSCTCQISVITVNGRTIVPGIATMSHTGLETLGYMSW